MRLALLLAVVVLAGCANTARTVTAPPPSWRDTQGEEHHPAYVLAPVYADERALVFLACERAALGYLGHVDEEDAAAGTLLVHETNAWFGRSDVAVALAAVEGGTRVDVRVDHPGAELAQDREGAVLAKYVARVDLELRTVRGLRAVLAQPTSAGLRADTAATSTSRP